LVPVFISATAEATSEQDTMKESRWAAAHDIDQG